MFMKIFLEKVMRLFFKFLLLAPFFLQANPGSESEGSDKSEETQVGCPTFQFDNLRILENKTEEGLQMFSKAAQLKQQEVELLMAELDDSNKELEDSTRLLEQAAEKGQKLQEDKTKLANKIRELKPQITTLESEILVKQEEIHKLEDERDEYRKKLEISEKISKRKSMFFSEIFDASLESAESFDNFLKCLRKSVRFDD